VTRLHLHLIVCGALALGAAPQTIRAAASSSASRLDFAPPAPQAARALLVDVARTGDRLVAAGAFGMIVFSDDDGQTWKQASVPTHDMLTALCFVDPRIGWAVGHGGTVLRSGDAGQTWENIAVPVEPETSFLDVFALDARHVIVVGAYEVFLETRDGGHTWDQRRAFAPAEGADAAETGDVFLNRITRGPSGALYLAGEYGTLARSGDQGATWQKLESPYDGSFYGLYELAGGRLLAHGLRGRVFTSDDEGATWRQVPLTQQVLIMAAAEGRKGLVVLAGLGGHLFISKDGADSFRAEKPDRLTGTAEVVFAADGSLICVGETGVHRLPPP
jgi:photosystem II stability/assembly factor-like uncharacterized protein